MPSTLKRLINAVNHAQLLDEFEDDMVAGRRILHVSDSLQMGGAERVLIELAAGLVDRGARVTVACSVGGPLEVEAHRAGVEVRLLGSSLVKRRLDGTFACASPG